MWTCWRLVRTKRITMPKWTQTRWTWSSGTPASTIWRLPLTELCLTSSSCFQLNFASLTTTTGTGLCSTYRSLLTKPCWRFTPLYRGTSFSRYIQYFNNFLNNRVFHIGSCGVHHKTADCSPEKQVKVIEEMYTAFRSKFFPAKVSVMRRQGKKTKMVNNGGWNDPRDHQLCIQYELPLEQIIRKNANLKPFLLNPK